MTDLDTFSNTVLVVGGGAMARAVVGFLAGSGCGAIILDPDGTVSGTMGDVMPNGGAEIWSPADLVSFDGFPGAFHVSARLANGRRVAADAGAVILASEGRLADPYAAWGLAESGTVVSLSRLEESFHTDDSEMTRTGSGQTHVMISGFAHTPNPISQRRGMEAAIRLAERDDARVFFLLEHFKVADSGLERLARRAREAGVLFAKLSSAPVIEMTGDRARVTFDDDALGEKVSLRPDRVILEEALEPAPYTGPMAALLGIHTGPCGFFSGRQCEQPTHIHEPHRHMGGGPGQGAGFRYARPQGGRCRGSRSDAAAQPRGIRSSGGNGPAGYPKMRHLSDLLPALSPQGRFIRETKADFFRFGMQIVRRLRCRMSHGRPDIERARPNESGRGGGWRCTVRHG